MIDPRKRYKPYSKYQLVKALDYAMGTKGMGAFLNQPKWELINTISQQKLAIRIKIANYLTGRVKEKQKTL